MHAQNGRLRWVDYGCAIEGPKHASIGYCEGASVHILNGEETILSLELKRDNNCLLTSILITILVHKYDNITI